MAHFNLNLDDMNDPASLNTMVLANQQSYTPTGQAKALKTTGAISSEPKTNLTTWGVADIMQGTVLYKPEALAYSQFNEVLTKDLQDSVTKPIEGQIAVMGHRVALLPPGLGKLYTAADGMTGGFGSSGVIADPNTPTGTPTPAGWVFPVRTTKTVIRQGGWPSENPNNVHHSYNAADIFLPPGTPIVACMSGLVIGAKQGGDLGWRVRIQGDDGLWYYFAHMWPDRGTVQKGQTVTAGQQLGECGNSADAQGTTPHLHFDISPVVNDFRRGYGGSDGPLLNPQPFLIEAFKGLPE